MTLPVPFLRQQRDTCAPTSLAMLCAFWGRPVDHVALAAAICYDGTPGHAERHWAETEGWTVRYRWSERRIAACRRKMNLSWKRSIPTASRVER